MRLALFLAAGFVGVLAFLANFTPWWFYPGTDKHWNLTISVWPPSSCVPAGDTVRLRGRRSTGGNLGYDSRRRMARAVRRFRWSVVPPTDSFWVSKHGGGRELRGRLRGNHLLDGGASDFIQ